MDDHQYRSICPKIAQLYTTKYVIKDALPAEELPESVERKMIQGRRYNCIEKAQQVIEFQ